MKTYSDLIAGMRLGENSASLELTPDWMQGRTAFGGWQAALAVRAMRQQVGDEIPLRTVQSNFIAPLALGTITAQAQILRGGKSATQVDARILVDGQVAFHAVGIFGAPRNSQIVENPRAPASIKDANDVAQSPFIEGLHPQFTRHFDMRWGAGGPPYSGAVSASAQIFVRFRGEDVQSESHLVAIGDAIPPSAISLLKQPVMVSTMNWTLELVTPLSAQAKADWLRFDASLTAASNGYAWEDVSIWSSTGDLIALSRQCVAVFG